MFLTKRLRKTIINILANLQFAIFLLILIVFYSISGSIIEQDQPFDYYIENYNQIKILNLFSASTLILNIGLDHIFSTFWFYFLIFIFSLSLIICSITTQFPIFLFSKSNRFFYLRNIPKTLQICKTLSIIKIFSINHVLIKKNYLLFQKKNSFYSYKGLIGKFAPLLIHLSLITVIFGSIIATLASFSSQELIPKTEITTIQNITRKNIFSLIPSYSIRVNDFWIDYTKNTDVNQYFSDISILNKFGNEEFRKTISVNHPVRYKNLAIYQTDWNLSALRIKVNNNEVLQIPLTPLKDQKKSWIGNIILNQKQYFLVVQKLNGLVSVYDSNGQLIQTLEFGERMVDFQLIDLIPATGLQLKSDPGVPVLYLGFFFLMISIVLNNQYFPELWLSNLESKNKIILVGKTNRSLIGFNIEIFKILKELVL